MAGDSVTNLGPNIIEILSLAQETVEFLSLVSFNDELDGGPLLHGSFPADSPDSQILRGPHELPHDPAFAPLLRTLHVNDTVQFRRFPSVMAQNHPFLSRLRISRFFDVQNRTTDLIRLLYVMRIASARGYFKDTVPPTQMRPGVQRLILVEPGTHRVSSLAYRLAHELLQELHVRCRGFHLLPNHPNHKMTREAQLALRDWTLCAIGKSMPWGVATDKPVWDDNLILGESSDILPQRSCDI